MKAPVALALQVTSRIGEVVISDTDPTAILQAPIQDKDFFGLMAQLQPKSDEIEIGKGTDQELLSAAKSLLPASGPWSISNPTNPLVLNSCLKGKKWEPCPPNSKCVGFVIQYNTGSLLPGNFLEEVDENSITTVQLVLEVLIAIQVG